MNQILFLAFFLLSNLSFLLRSYAQPGSLDRAYKEQLGSGFDGSINDVIVQPDGKLIVGGRFAKLNGTAYNRIIRLQNNGSVDTLFKMGTGVGSEAVECMALQPDGKILLGGPFGTYNGMSSKNIVRINSDGSIDATFKSIFVKTWVAIYCIAVQSDGKILVASSNDFTGTNPQGIVRLNSDGSMDSSFNIGGLGITGNYVYAIALQKDGKIVAAGDFTAYNGITSGNIVRLNTDGTLDNTFSTGTGFDKYVQVLQLQADGKILVGGDFTTFNGNPQSRLIRLNSDGSKDAGFSIGSGFDQSPSLRGIKLQSDGKIWTCGYFTTFNGVSCQGIACIDQNGSLDVGFNNNVGRGFKGVYSWNIPNAISIQRDGKIVVGGAFNRFDDTVVVSGLARLNGVPLGISNLDPTPGYCPGSDFKVEFTASGQQFNTGNIFTAQLSDANGSFSTPVNIGTLNGTQVGLIDAIIPSGTSLGTGYRTRVVSSNPALTGFDNGTDIVISGTPVVVAHASTTDVCAGSSVILSGSGAGRYTWDNGVMDGISFKPTVTATYTVSGFNGQCKSSSKITVNVHSLPLVRANASDTVVCAGEKVTLSGSGATTYSWDKGVADGVAFVPTTTTTYQVIGTDAHCSDTDRVMITVMLPPTVTVQSSASSICYGASVTLKGGGALTYTWDNEVKDGVAFEPQATATYTVTGSNEACSDTVQIQIVVRGTPTVLNDTVCAEGAYSFGQQILKDSGTYTEKFRLEGNCDSVVTLHLWKNIIDVSVTQTDRTLNANETNATYQWIDCNKQGSPIIGAKDQSFSSNVDGSFAVIVSKDGCSDTSACYSVVTTGIQDIDGNGAWLLYPNPTNGLVYLSMPSRSKSANLVVYNVMGQVLLQHTEISDQKVLLNFSNYPSGIYILEIEEGTSIRRLKIVRD